MSKQVVDIVSIIENNPIKKFMGNYGSKILERISLNLVKKNNNCMLLICIVF